MCRYCESASCFACGVTGFRSVLAGQSPATTRPVPPHDQCTTRPVHHTNPSPKVLAEELLYFFQVGCAAVAWQALHEDSAVLFFQDAIVE